MISCNRYATLSDRQLQEVHATCEVFEHALRNGEPVTIEKYLANTADAIHDILFHELLAIELERQLPSEQWPQVEVYRARFPKRQLDIDRVIAEVSMAWSAEANEPITPPKTFAISGRNFESRYRLEGEIARGGMGIIHKGCDTELGRELAIKVLHDAHTDNPQVIQRFIDEAQIGGQLQHPGIAPVYELGQFADKRPFFSMKLVKGETLAKLLSQREKSADERGKFLGIFLKVCETMAYAHSRSVIHRDLKPSNIMVGAFGEVQVMDWGLAKVLARDLGASEQETRDDQQHARVIHTLRSGVGGDTPSTFGIEGSETQLGSVMGTPAYMPPEQALGEIDTMDERADVFGLGAILCEILTAYPPYVGNDSEAVFRQAAHGAQDDCYLRLDTCGMDTDLTALTKACLEPKPINRPRDAREVAALVSGYLASVEVRLRATEMDRAIQTERLEQQQRSAGKLQQMIAGLAVVATLAVATAIVAGSLWRDANFARRNAEISEKLARKSAITTTEQRKRADHEAETAQQNLFYAQMHLAQQAWREHRGLRHMRDLLNNWLPQDESMDRRGWEWFYLESLPFQNQRTLTDSGPAGKPSTVVWHIASQQLAEGTADGVIRIWDVDQQQVTKIIKGGVPAVTYWGSHWLAWSPDGESIAAGCLDGTVQVWEIASGREFKVLRGPQSPIRFVAFNSTGTRVASWGEDGTISIWETSTGRLTSEVAHPGGVSAGAWSPDNELLATGHFDGTVSFSGMDTGATLETLRAHPDSIYHLEWSPDSTRLATTSSNDFFVSIWDVASQEKVLGPLRHSHGITSIAWEPNGERLATGSMDETIKLWNAATGLEKRTIRGHVETVTALSWGPQGRLASAGSDGSVKVWDSGRDQESTVWQGHVSRATTVSWSANGEQLASGGDDGYVRIWNPNTLTAIAAFKAHENLQQPAQFGVIGSLAWSPDGKRLASAGADCTAKVWEAVSGRELYALPAKHGKVWSVAWSPDGTRLAVGSEDGTIRIVEGFEHIPSVRDFQAHANNVRTLAWSPQGDRLASGAWTDPVVRLWDPANGTELNHLEGHRGSVLSVTWSPDGKQLASASSDFCVIAWEAETGLRLTTMRGHNDFVNAVDWSPDGTRLASAGFDNAVRVWDPRTGEETFVLRGHSGMFHHVAWSADGGRLAAASSDGQLWIWDASHGLTRAENPLAAPSGSSRVEISP